MAATVSFAENFGFAVSQSLSITAASLTFFPFNFKNTISLNTLNVVLTFSASKSVSLSLGIYSLSAGTLSLVNSASTSKTGTTGVQFVSLSSHSVSSVFVPGTLWFGLLASGSASVFGAFTGNATNAFPGALIGGRMTVSTTSLPATVNTTDLNTTGGNSLFVPYILIST